MVFNQVEAVTAPDKYTVVMSLKEPFAPLLAFLALPSSAAAIMPKEIAEATPAGPVTEYVGTGPYRFVEWIPNRHIKLARWDKYAPRSEAASGYAGRRDPLVDEVIYYPVGNVATRIAGVQAGDYDIADADQHRPLRAAQGRRPRGSGRPRARELAGVLLQQEGRHHGQRQAPAGRDGGAQHAADPAGHRGESRPLPADAQHLSQGNALVHGGRRALVQPGQRPDQAKQLAAEAGYKGEPIRWLTTQQYDWSHKSSTVAAAQLKQAGFNVDMQVYEWAGVVERRAKPTEWELFTTLHGFVPDPALIDVFSPAYPGWWETPAKNQLLQELNRALDQQTRVQTWQKLQELVFTEGGWVKTGDYLFIRLRAKGVEGYKPLGIGMIVWNVSVPK